MKKEDLFKKALEYKTINSNCSQPAPLKEGELEIAIAYLMGEITLRQFGHAVDAKHPGSMSHRVLSVLLQGLKNGDVVLQLRKPSKRNK